MWGELIEILKKIGYKKVDVPLYDIADQIDFPVITLTEKAMNDKILQVLKDGKQYTLDEIVISIVKTELNNPMLTVESIRKYLQIRSSVFQQLLNMVDTGKVRYDYRSGYESKFSCSNQSI